MFLLVQLQQLGFGIEVLLEAAAEFVQRGLASGPLDDGFRVTAEQGGDIGAAMQPRDALELLPDAQQFAARTPGVAGAVQVQKPLPGGGQVDAFGPGSHKSQLACA